MRKFKFELWCDTPIVLPVSVGSGCNLRSFLTRGFVCSCCSWILSCILHLELDLPKIHGWVICDPIAIAPPIISNSHYFAQLLAPYCCCGRHYPDHFVLRLFLLLHPGKDERCARSIFRVLKPGRELNYCIPLREGLDEPVKVQVDAGIV